MCTSIQRMSKEESSAALETNRSTEPSHTPLEAQKRAPPAFVLPFFNPHLDVSGLVNTVADCFQHNSRTPHHEISMRLHSARCELPGFSPKYFVSCRPYKVFVTRSGTVRQLRQPGLPEYAHYCPQEKVCMPFHLRNLLGDPDITADEYKDIQCVNPEALVVEHIEAVVRTAHQQCSTSHQVPGGYLPASNTGLDLILSEALFWANGSTYKVPAMFIVDESSNKPYDRAYEMNTNIVSTGLKISSYRGHLQNRIMKFCFEQVSGAHSSAVMLYTWFRMSPGHTRAAA